MKTLLLIDAHAFIHRSYHALPSLTTPEGEPIGAIYGLASTLLKELRDHRPDYVAAAFDRPEPTFRKEMFADYKAHRPPAVDELVSQIIKAHELFQKFGIPIFELPGYEADDVIGTFVKKLESDDLHIIVLTGDLDTLQLVKDDRVVVQTPKRGAELSLYNESAVIERFGLPPRQLPDYKGLVGDPSDNIPGVRGIGPKGAQKLLQEFGTLETLYSKLSPTHPLAKKLIPQKEGAFFSRMLATIKTDVPLQINLPSLVFKGVPLNTLKPYFQKLGFQSIVNRLQTTDRINANETPNEPKYVSVTDEIDPEQRQDILSSPTLKVAYEWKELIKWLEERDIRVAPPLFDLRVAGWLIDPGQTDFSLEALAKRFLKISGMAGEELTQKLFSFFWNKLQSYGLMRVFQDIEMPLVPILAHMEELGIGVSVDALRALQKKIQSETETLAKKIYEEADETFNVNSPQQVSRILFEKLGLGPSKKRKTGSGHSRTGRDILDTLKTKHPIANLLIEYRENSKIKTGFVDPFIDFIGPDGRIHTTFLQTGTATGRLASEKPNVQNIPQESKWSLPLRRAFMPKKDFTFLALDYSQLELRLLAEVSGDEKLRQAFRQGKDIHTMTASNVFNIAESAVDASTRRLAKTLNFGIVYGMGARAFAEASGVSQEKASHFIDEYFGDFPAVKEWQKQVIEEMHTFGYVTNKNGRRRWFLDVLRNPSRGDLERQAVNMPIQSLGADIVKLAMIGADHILEEKGFQENAHLLLSIHDELLFEVRDDILKIVLPFLKDVMEHVYPLSVPLIVEVKQGPNWGDMKRIS